MITGGISGGFANFVGGNLPQNLPAQFLGRTAIGGITGGITAEIYGGNFGQGFVYGAGTAAYGYICNHVLHDIFRGIRKAAVEGAKAGKYSVYEAGKSVFKIAKEGPIEAKIALGLSLSTTVVPLTYAGGYYTIVEMYPAFMMWAGSIEGQQLTVGFVNFFSSALPGIPVNNQYGIAGFIAGWANSAIFGNNY